MMELKQDIKKRTELSKYLEYAFFNDAAESFLKIHRCIILDNDLELKKLIKYSSFFTRVWLNYLNNDQFEKILSKKLRYKYFK